MTNIDRVRTVLTGFSGGPGVATFYSLDGPSLVSALNSFWDDVKGHMPLDFTALTEDSGDRIDAATGDLIGTWTGGSGTGITGTQAGVYAAPAGALMHWETGAVLDGHRVRGRTFLVPMAAAAFDVDGSLEAGALSSLRSAGVNMISRSSPDFVVWHRPFAGAPAVGGRPARPAHDGAAAIVTSSSVPDRIVILRSRRD